MDEIESVLDLSQVAGFDFQKVVDIECRRKNHNVGPSETEMVTCNLQDGFLCQHDIQPDNECDDYEVRLARVKETENCTQSTTSMTTHTWYIQS